MDCATVTTATCTASNYFTGYNGWAIGINFSFKSELPVQATEGTAGSTVGLCFVDTKQCVAVTAPKAAGDTNAYGIFSWTTTTAPEIKTYPTAWTSITGMKKSTVTSGGFDTVNFYGAASGNNTSLLGANKQKTLSQTIYRYQDSTTK
jgi:hypothetical protein